MTALSLFGAAEASPERSPASAVSALDSAPAPQQSLYRKYRPQSFDDHDLVGQEHIVRTIRNAIRLGRVAHAYLFCGPRGTGKTTTARLLAKAVNCLDPDPDRRPCNRCDACTAINRGSATDIVEIDAASNRGIDDIRDLRERVKYAPTQLRSKFYIVDEAHQITGAAANAFLKTLEEPPPHTRFVLATTDPEELLPTIVSRCQRFDFRRIGSDAMVGRLRVVADHEAIAIDDGALWEIVRHATGSLRDALGLLDQLALHGTDSTNEGTIDAESVRALLGISRNDRVAALLSALSDRDVTSALTVVNEAVEAGEDPRQLNRQLVSALRDHLHGLAGGRVDRDVRLSAPGKGASLDLGRVAELLRRFSEVDYKIRHSPYAHLPLELALVESIVGPPERQVGRHDSLVVEEARSLETLPVYTGSQQAAEPTETRASTSLRDRVRGVPPSPSTLTPPRQGSRMPASELGSGPARAAVSLVDGANTETSPPGNSPRTTEPAMPSVSGDGAITVERLADLWPRIRQDVKALNRRVEALLSSFDPARVTGDSIHLATPYEFHRDKLNSDEVRALVEQVIGRLVGRSVSVSGVLVGDVGPPPHAVPSVRAIAPESIQVPELAKPNPDGMGVIPDEVHDRRLQSAKNIFDAEEETETA